MDKKRRRETPVYQHAIDTNHIKTKHMNRILITVGSSLLPTSISSVLSSATSYVCKEKQQQQPFGITSPEPSLDNNLLVWEFLDFLRSLFYNKLLQHQYHDNNTIYYIHVPFKHNCRTVLITWYKQTNNRWGQWCGMSLHFKQPNNMYICRIFVVVIRCSTPLYFSCCCFCSIVFLEISTRLSASVLLFTSFLRSNSMKVNIPVPLNLSPPWPKPKRTRSKVLLMDQ